MTMAELGTVLITGAAGNLGAKTGKGFYDHG